MKKCDIEEFFNNEGTKIATMLASLRNPKTSKKYLKKIGGKLYLEACEAGMQLSSFSSSKVYSWVDDQILYTLTSARLSDARKTELVNQLQNIAQSYAEHATLNYAHIYAWKHMESVANLERERGNLTQPTTVAVDIDGVLYDVDGVMWRWLVNQGYPPPSHEIRTYSMGQNWNLEEEVVTEEFGKAVDAGFMFRYGDAYKESVNAVRRIFQKGHKVVLITARDLTGRENKCHQATLKWLRENGVPFDELHITSEKEKVNFDILIDDAPGNIERVMSNGKRGYILHRPWNRDEGEGYDRGTWVDILMHLEGLDEKMYEFGEGQALSSPVRQLGTHTPTYDPNYKGKKPSTPA